MKNTHTATSPITTCELISREAAKPRSPQGRVGSPQRTQNSGAMRRSFRFSAFFFALFLAAASTSFGQILTFDFASLTGNETTAVSNSNDAGLTASTISRGSGLTASGNSGRFNATNWGNATIENAVTNSKYMEFTITPNSGQQFTVSSIFVQWQRSSTGNTRIALRSSADNYTADLDTVKTVADNTNTQNFTWTFSQAASTSPVTYRFYSIAEATSGSGGPGDGTGNDIVVTGTVSPASATAPTITSFNPTSGAVGNSVTITGTNFASNATVSFNGTSSTSVTFTNNTSLTATVPAGATSGPITVTVGAESGVSSTSFTVINPSAPAISTNGTFTAFSTTSGNASAAQTLGVTGTNLTASITATAPTGFEVSTDGTSFASNATITQSSGNATATLSVRIASTASAGALTGNLVLSSTGATSISIPLSGNVTGISTDSLATWVGTGNLNNANATVSANAAALNVASATVSRTGLTYSPNANRYSSTGWNATTNFLSITVNAATGYTLDLNGANFTAAMASSNTGPANYQVFSSADNFAAALGTLASSNSTYPSTTIALSGAGFTGLSSITFRIVGNQTAWNGSATPGTGTGGPNSIIVTGTVNPDSGVTAPSITSATSANATVGTAFSYTITASNSPASFGATGLPAGLTVNATTGVISGTPTTAGNSNATITATNLGGTGNATLAFTIAQGTPVITTPPTASAITAGQALSASTLTGGLASVAGSFAFADPSFIPGATGSQIVVFTPSDAANYTTANTSATVTVNPAPSSPFETWAGGNVTMTPAVLSLYAIGGGSYNGSVAPEAPVLTTTGGNLSLTAIVRTDDPALTVSGQSLTDLVLGTWSSSEVTSTTEGLDQTGLAAQGLERRRYSVPATGTKKFLRLRAVYAGDN